jgi:hypothetical protein
MFKATSSQTGGSQDPLALDPLGPMRFDPLGDDDDSPSPSLGLDPLSPVVPEEPPADADNRDS